MAMLRKCLEEIRAAKDGKEQEQPSKQGCDSRCERQADISITAHAIGTTERALPTAYEPHSPEVTDARKMN